MMPRMVMMCRVEYTVINITGYFHSRGIYVSSFSGLCYYYSCNSAVVFWGTSPMLLCFPSTTMISAKARPAQMIFTTTSI